MSIHTSLYFLETYDSSPFGKSSFFSPVATEGRLKLKKREEEDEEKGQSVTRARFRSPRGLQRAYMCKEALSPWNANTLHFPFDVAPPVENYFENTRHTPV